MFQLGEEFSLDTYVLIESSNAPIIFQVCHISNHDEDATLAISGKVCLHTTQVIRKIWYISLNS